MGNYFILKNKIRISISLATRLQGVNSLHSASLSRAITGGVAIRK